MTRSHLWNLTLTGTWLWPYDPVIWPHLHTLAICLSVAMHEPITFDVPILAVDAVQSWDHDERYPTQSLEIYAAESPTLGICTDFELIWNLIIKEALILRSSSRPFVCCLARLATAINSRERLGAFASPLSKWWAAKRPRNYQLKALIWLAEPKKVAYPASHSFCHQPCNILRIVAYPSPYILASINEFYLQLN